MTCESLQVHVSDIQWLPSATQYWAEMGNQLTFSNPTTIVFTIIAYKFFARNYNLL